MAAPLVFVECKKLFIHVIYKVLTGKKKQVKKKIQSVVMMTDFGFDPFTELCSQVVIDTFYKLSVSN